MPTLRFLVASNKEDAVKKLKGIDKAWKVVDDACGDFDGLRYTRANPDLGAPDSFSITDADGMIHVIVLRRD